MEVGEISPVSALEVSHQSCEALELFASALANLKGPTMLSHSNPPTPDPLIPRRGLRAVVTVSDMTLHRWLTKGLFPAPAMTMCGLRYWHASDIAAWKAGKRSGWTADDAAASIRRDHTAAARANRHAPELALAG